MDTQRDHTPLTAQELIQLGEILSQVANPRALSLEGMDGLFCALIAGPAWVVRSEYLPLLWGGPLLDESALFNVAHVNAMIWLLARHWNSILTALDRGDAHTPLIVHPVASGTPGRTWAQGFMRGVNFVQVGWKDLLQDETASELYRGSPKIPVSRCDKITIRRLPWHSHFLGSPQRWRMPISIS
jgi:yecA family protein